MFLKKILMGFLFLYSSVIAFNCNYNSSAESFSVKKFDSILDEKHSLMNDLSEKGALLIYSVDNLSDTLKYLPIIEGLKKSYFFPRVTIKRYEEVSEEELKNSALIIIGSYNTNEFLQKINNEIPVDFQSNQFSFNDRIYSGEDETVSLIYRNPFNKNKLLLIFSGNSNEYIYSNLSFNFIGDLSISKNTEREFLGFYKYDADLNWIIDKSLSRNYVEQKQQVNAFKHYNYIIHFDDYDFNLLRKEALRNDSLFEAANIFFNSPISKTKTDIHIYKSFEDKGLIIGSTELNSINPADSSIHLVMNDFIIGNDFSKNAELLAHHFLGDAKTKFLKEGLAVHFSNEWREKGYEYWSSKIFLSGNIPSLKDLLNNEEINFISYLIYQPLAGSFISFLIDKFGKEYFISHYSNWIFNSNEINGMEKEWHSYLSKIASDYKAQIDNDNWMNRITLPTFQKGFCFAHVGYQIYNGYASQKAVESLMKMKTLGANSFSMTPFTYMRDPNKPVKLKYWEFAEGESIESMINLMNAARDLNLTAMLKPHIYLGENNWPGVIEMKSEKDWKLFFYYYEKWIMHYAIFAEMYHVPLFVIGNEFSKASINHEQEWIELSKKIRKIYSGKIVYAPNWGDEFEKLTFWNHFDNIGLSEYYPISEKDNPTDEELLKGAEDVVNRIEQVHQKFNKPVIFTEAGFRASTAPWKTALEKEGRDEIHLQNQVRCYKALFTAIENEDWLKGIYWWKWPSYLEYKGFTFGEGYDLYSPNNDGTEKVIKEWYSKIF